MARRRRKDPDAAPIDGDYTRDQVLNKDPDKAYALVSIDDMPVMTGRGYVRTTSGARPAWDTTSKEGEERMVNAQLVLMETSKERAEAIQARGEREFAARTAGLRKQIQEHVAANPGSEFRRAAG